MNFPTTREIDPEGDLVPTVPVCVCPKVKDMGPFFWLLGSEMNENISLKMGVKLAASLNMGKNLYRVLYIYNHI